MNLFFFDIIFLKYFFHIQLKQISFQYTPVQITILVYSYYRYKINLYKNILTFY